MKRKYPISDREPDRNFRSVALFALLTLSCAWCWLAWVPARAQASVELDRRYSLDTVGFLRATDNVDGLFADYVQKAYTDYFSRQSRFVVQDLSKADTLLSHSKLPYWKLIQDPQILLEVARVTHSQTIIRTRVTKTGPEYRISMEWLHGPQMLPLATESTVLKEPGDGESFGFNEIESQIESSLDEMIRKVPWVGRISGRDNQQVTVNIGSNANVHKGDTLVISTLDDVRRHPLLHTIVQWKLTRTGEVLIDSVGDSIGFGHVIEEEPGQHVGRFQKVTQIIPASDQSTFPVVQQKVNKQKILSQEPRLGFLKASLWPGGFSRSFSSSTSADSRDGGGFFLGAKLDAQLWLTREWFSELGFGYGFWNYSQSPTGSNQPTSLTGSSNVTTFKIDGGYSYLVTGDFYGPKAFAKLGYRSESYSLPDNSSESVGPISFGSLFLGLGGDLPIREQWGVDLDFDIGVINSVTESGSFNPGSAASSSVVSFSLGGYDRISNRLTFRAALEVMAQSADFSNNTSISQKIITFTPSLIYYF